MISFLLAKKLWGLLLNLIGLYNSFSVFTFFIKRGNFVYYNWGCTIIDHPLSYPLRSLSNKDNFDIITEALSLTECKVRTLTGYNEYAHIQVFNKLRSVKNVRIPEILNMRWGEGI